MKTINYAIAALLMTLSITFISCEPNEPETEEITKIKEWLCNKDWGLEKRIFSDTVYIANEQVEAFKNTIQYTLYKSSVWRFSKKKLSVTKYGDFNGCDYRLEINESGDIQLFISEGFDNILGYGSSYIENFYIYGYGTDSLLIRFNRELHEQMNGQQDERYCVDEYYFRKLDYEAHEREQKELEEKIASMQKRMKGEWFFDKYLITTDYKDGYSDADGQTHTEKEVKNSEPYYAVKINCENAPATDSKPSTFIAGWYENGKATYSLTPANYGIRDEGQWYTVEMQHNDTLYVDFRNFQLVNTNGSYRFNSKRVNVITITDDCIIMERDEAKTTDDKKTIISESHVKEYWMRQK